MLMVATQYHHGILMEIIIALCFVTEWEVELGHGT